MLNKSKQIFINDNYIRLFQNFELFYSFNKKIETSSIEKNLADLYNRVEKHLKKKVALLGKKIEKIYYHERFGWVIESESNKAFLGKLIFSGAPKIDIGSYSYLSGASTINGNDELQIGSFCSIANGVQFFLSNINHPMHFASTFNFYSNARIVMNKENLNVGNYSKEIERLNKKRNIDIGNDVWIGRDVMILNGVKIADGCVIGARSTVIKDCEPFGVYVGTPAKLIKYRFRKDIIEQLLEIKWWEWDIKAINKNKLFFDTDFNLYNKPLKTLFNEAI